MKLMLNYLDLQGRKEVVSEQQCFNHQRCTDTDINNKRQFPNHNSACRLHPGVHSSIFGEKPLAAIRN